MKSDLPKVCHEVAGRPIVWWVARACRAAGVERLVMVVGYKQELVRAVFDGDDADIRYAVQDEQLGTGHATMCGRDALADFDGDVLILAGDGPLIRAATIDAMLDRHRSTNAAATLATSVIDDPTGYGRIVRDANDRFEAIVEQKNATPAQLAIREVYPSYACFDAGRLFACLETLEPNELTGEYYVTDVPAMLRAAGERVEVVDAVPPEDVLSINTPEQLAAVDAILAKRGEAGRGVEVS